MFWDPLLVLSVTRWIPDSEPVFLNIYGAQESIPENEISPAPIDFLKIPAQVKITTNDNIPFRKNKKSTAIKKQAVNNRKK